MNRSGWKRVIPSLIVSFVLLAAPVRALAAEDEDFSLASVPDLLPGGARLGTVSDLLETTRGFNGTGPCTTDAMSGGYPHASVFRVTTDVRALLSVDVDDDLGGSLSLCRIALYAASSDLDPFDSGARADALVEATDDCASASSCAMRTWLSAGHTYLLVLWAAPPEGSTPRDASFSLDASVKEPPPMSVGVTGHRIRESCSGYHEVITGRYVTVTVVSPLDQTVSFVLEQPAAGGTWSTVATYERALTSGRAALSLRAWPAGRFRLRVLIDGTDTRLDGVSDVALHFLTPRWKRYADGGIRLSVPWYHQQYRLSCEAATLRMAHNYHNPGAISSDARILRVIGVDKRLPRGGRWGNPNKVFVGYVNGRMMKSGYGVHYGPVARAASYFDRCRPSLKLHRASRQTIARHVSNGFPVIVWGAHRGPTGIKRVRWRAWDGQSITAYSVEHTWVVIGFRGPVTDPKAFIIHDPSGRARRTVSASEFYAFTRYFRTGVVVRG